MIKSDDKKDTETVTVMIPLLLRWTRRSRLRRG